MMCVGGLFPSRSFQVAGVFGKKDQNGIESTESKIMEDP